MNSMCEERRLDEATKKTETAACLTAAADPVLAELWDNEEDSIYDDYDDMEPE